MDIRVCDGPYQDNGLDRYAHRKQLEFFMDTFTSFDRLKKTKMHFRDVNFLSLMGETAHELGGLWMVTKSTHKTKVHALKLGRFHVLSSLQPCKVTTFQFK